MQQAAFTPYADVNMLPDPDPATGATTGRYVGEYMIERAGTYSLQVPPARPAAPGAAPTPRCVGRIRARGWVVPEA